MSYEEDVKLLEAVRNWRPPTKLHPIAMAAWGLYEDRGGQFGPEGVEQLRKVLDGYGDDLERLAEACEGLTRFVMYVSQNLKDEKTGEAVVELMREYAPLYEPFWQRVGEALANVGAHALGVFREFVGQDKSADKRAPHVGATPPEGAIAVKNLMPMTRPPAWSPPVIKVSR